MDKFCVGNCSPLIGPSCSLVFAVNSTKCCPFFSFDPCGVARAAGLVFFWKVLLGSGFCSDKSCAMNCSPPTAPSLFSGSVLA